MVQASIVTQLELAQERKPICHPCLCEDLILKNKEIAFCLDLSLRFENYAPNHSPGQRGNTRTH